jgi:hypothetical protein
VNRLDVEAVWRESWLLAPDGASAFGEQLTAGWRSARALNAGGSLSNISRNSSSHGFAQPDSSHRTTVDAERVALTALKYYESLLSALGVSADEAGELAVYNEGVARGCADAFQVPEYRSDFTNMRL